VANEPATIPIPVSITVHIWAVQMATGDGVRIKGEERGGGLATEEVSFICDGDEIFQTYNCCCTRTSIGVSPL